MATRLIFLGTGTPNPDAHRLGPSTAVVVDDQPYIVDCGVGLVRRAASVGLSMDRLTRAFITHLHSDHTLGYPDLIFTPAVTGRTEPLQVWGPPGTRAMTDHILAAWDEDVQTRLHGGEPSIPQAYKVQVTEMEPGEVYRDENVRVVGFRVKHGKWRHAFGFRFETRERVIVFSGDTTYCQELVEHARGCDVLIHEVYSARGLEEREPEWQAYHSAYHTSGPDLGRLAAQIRPKLLLLYHVLPFGQDEDQVVEEVRSEFDGEILLANDTQVY